MLAEHHHGRQPAPILTADHRSVQQCCVLAGSCESARASPGGRWCSRSISRGA